MASSAMPAMVDSASTVSSAATTTHCPSISSSTATSSSTGLSPGRRPVRTHTQIFLQRISSSSKHNGACSYNGVMSPTTTSTLRRLRNNSITQHRQQHKQASSAGRLVAAGLGTDVHI